MPGDPVSRWKLGQVHERYGKRGRAIEEYRKALAVRPGFREARQSLESALRASAPEEDLR